MGIRSAPLLFVCRGCKRNNATWSTSNKGIYCNKKCRADHERKGASAPNRYKQGGYWMLRWTLPGGTKHRPVRSFQFEHRKVWEEQNGPIPDGFILHHINGDKLDNRLSNLRLMRRSDHVRLHKLGSHWKVAK